MKNAVLMMMYNTTTDQLRLAQQTFASIVAQDIGSLAIYLVNDGSLPETGTAEWLASLGNEVPGPAGSHLIRVRTNPVKTDVLASRPTQTWNEMHATIYADGFDNILGVNSDVILPRNLYRELNRWPRGLVSACSDGPPPPDLPQDHISQVVGEAIDPCVMVTRKWAHDGLVEHTGYYLDPAYFLYVSDPDLKLRMAACGIHGVKTDILCWHYGSACWKLAKPETGRVINEQSERDRRHFIEKWGFAAGSPECIEAILDLNYCGRRVE
jgi:hypothetical protein